MSLRLSSVTGQESQMWLDTSWSEGSAVFFLKKECTKKTSVGHVQPYVDSLHGLPK